MEKIDKMNQKRIVNVSSYQRIDSLIRSLKSIYDQCDVINVCLNNHEGNIPAYLLSPKINLTLTDNSKGDAFKFLYLEESDGYYLTIDDDLIYPPNYVDYMISKSKEYRDKKIITLHGRSFSKFPIQSYYRSATERYQCLGEVNKDTKVQFGGTGVMCFHTSLLKISINNFYYPNMADVWIGKFAQQSGVEIICVSHKVGYIREIPQKITIYGTESKDDTKQTNVVNQIFGNKKTLNNFKIVTISTFWNCERYVVDCIDSLKNQTHFDFISYFIDDMSTDRSYELAKKAIGNDGRFILIKNTEKKYKTKNFVDIIRNNYDIYDMDVIIELDGDDRLSDNSVLGRIYNVFSDTDIWLCGTRWKDARGNLGNYKKPIPERVRTTSWNFSHMRSFRAFLFRHIKDEHLKMNGEYFKGACDMGHAIPMLEMSGSEHFYYINEPLYIYNWHNNQSYSEKGGIGDKTTQSKTGGYIYRLPPYNKLSVDITDFLIDNQKIKLKELNNIKKQEVFKKLEFLKKKSIDYELINKVLKKDLTEEPIQNVKPIKQNKPNKREELIVLKNGSNIKQVKTLSKTKNNRRNNLPNIF